MKRINWNIYKHKKGSISKEEISDLYINDFYLILFTVFLLVIETTILHNIRVFDVAPNLILVSLIVIMMFFDRNTIIKSAFYAGLLTDVMTGRGIGIHIVFYISVAFIILKFESVIFKDNYMPPMVLILFSTVSYHLYFVAINLFRLMRKGLFETFLMTAALESIYNMVVGFLIYKFIYFTIYGKRRDPVE